MKQIFIDVETTGTQFWKHSVHQISGLVYIDGNKVDSFDFKVRPHEKSAIDPEALEICKKTEEELLSYPHRSEVYPELIKILGKHVNKFNKTDKFFFCGYNSHFDNQFVRAFFAQSDDKYFGSWFWSGTIDVMVLALDYLQKKRHELEDFKLMTVAKALGIEIEEEKAHDSLYDVEITRKIYETIKIQSHENFGKVSSLIH